MLKKRFDEKSQMGCHMSYGASLMHYLISFTFNLKTNSHYTFYYLVYMSRGVFIDLYMRLIWVLQTLPIRNKLNPKRGLKFFLPILVLIACNCMSMRAIIHGKPSTTWHLLHPSWVNQCEQIHIEWVLI